MKELDMLKDCSQCAERDILRSTGHNKYSTQILPRNLEDKRGKY